MGAFFFYAVVLILAGIIITNRAQASAASVALTIEPVVDIVAATQTKCARGPVSAARAAHSALRSCLRKESTLSSVNTAKRVHFLTQSENVDMAYIRVYELDDDEVSLAVPCKKTGRNTGHLPHIPGRTTAHKYNIGETWFFKEVGTFNLLTKSVPTLRPRCGELRKHPELHRCDLYCGRPRGGRNIAPFVPSRTKPFATSASPSRL